MPSIRADIIDAYVFRRSEPRSIELLQLRRTREPMAGSWQPVMGHVEAGETAAACLWRELAEETGLRRGTTLGAWGLEEVHPFFLADRDEIVLSPRFAVEAPAGWEPVLIDEHDAARWVDAADAAARFLWPGQHAAIAELLGMLGNADRCAALRLP